MASLALTLSLLTPLVPHTTVELEDWLAQWTERAAGGLSSEHISAYRDMAKRHSCQAPFGLCAPAVKTRAVSTPQTLPARVFGGGVEQWRSLIEAYFPANHVATAMSVLACESKGEVNAWNNRSGASGLFQHMPRYWVDRSTKAGWGGYDIFHAEANIAVAAWLVMSDGWWHWSQCL